MIKGLLNALKKNWRKLIVYYFIILLLTALVLFPDLVFFAKNGVINYAVSGILIVQFLLFIPVFVFCRNLKIYYWILGILVALAPLMLFSVFYMNIQVNAEMVGLVLDTNFDEVKELLGWKIVLLIISMIAFCWVFIKLSSYLPSRISWKKGLVISLIGLGCFLLMPLIRTTDMRYYTSILRNTYRTFYPFRMQNIFQTLHEQLGIMDTYKNNTANFKFGAVNSDTGTERKIVVLVIGEASRSDHWHVNGYNRETSPEIEKLGNAISYRHAVSGGTMTIISVPQIISRATPEDFGRHVKEKSILAAYKEAGYYTAWISNQSQFGLAGNIGMHFHDGDTAIFAGHGENETNFTGNYDAALLPLLSNTINSHPDKNMFIILHLIGSHWRYLLRYPPSFEKFLPVSDRNRIQVVNPTKEEIINEYDNSILYTDHILKSIADTLNNEKGEAAFLFLSDHGESLDDDNDNTYFHSYKPVKATAIVPLIFWSNDRYKEQHTGTVEAIKSNENKKVSTALNVFYTLIDIGRLSLPGFDSSASLASPAFHEPQQKILGDADKIYYFKDLK